MSPAGLSPQAVWVAQCGPCFCELLILCLSPRETHSQDELSQELNLLFVFIRLKKNWQEEHFSLLPGMVSVSQNSAKAHNQRHCIVLKSIECQLEAVPKGYKVEATAQLFLGPPEIPGVGMVWGWTGFR